MSHNPYGPNTSQSSWRHSFLSLFRSGSRSPERGSRTSIHGSRTSIHVATVARVASVIGPESNSSRESVPERSTRAARLVQVSDFADSDISGDSDRLRDSETIFLVIESYISEPRYHFAEDIPAAPEPRGRRNYTLFESAEAGPEDTESDPSTEKGEETRRPFETGPEAKIGASGASSHVRDPTKESWAQETSAPILAPDSVPEMLPNLSGSRPTSDSSGSLSSGVLLSRLHSESPEWHDAPPSSHPSNPHSEDENQKARVLSSAPRVPAPKSPQRTSSSQKRAAPSGEKGSDAAPSAPVILAAPVIPPAPALTHVEHPPLDWAPMPQPNLSLERAHTHDSRHSDSSDMFSVKKNEKRWVDLEKNAEPLPVPWAKWAAVMVCGLVALPIYFMMAFGLFDHGGYWERPRGAGLGRAKYSKLQRVLSLCIGLVWLAIVFAMIGVGLGLAFRRHT